MPELRRDPISGRWVVFSPERLRRPIQYQLSNALQQNEEEPDPFLEGNENYTPKEVYAIRENGTLPNGPGWSLRVVPNKFPALRIEGELRKEAVGFYDQMNGIGAHEVVIETPEAHLELDQQPLSGIFSVLKAFRNRISDLLNDTRFRSFVIFKNVGPLAGASLPHPHSQIIGLPVTPILLKEKLIAAEKHFVQKDRNLFEDILKNEIRFQDRLIRENTGYAAFCPFASRFPFEASIIPKQQRADFHQCKDHELMQLAEILKSVLTAYRTGLDNPNYNLVLYTAPVRRKRHGYWNTIDQDFRWHLELLPRLSGIAGFELGTGFHINSVLPEEAASFLREASHD